MVTTSRALLVALLIAATGCGSQPAFSGSAPRATTSAAPLAPPPPTPPEGPPVLGIDWARAASVERPADAFAQPSPGASLPGPNGTGRSGHPLHFPGQAVMAAVVTRPSGKLVSVGYVYPGWHPAAWTSVDAWTWMLQPMGTTEFTFPVALAVGPTGTIVAVGRTGTAPIAWTSSDGRTWTPHAVPVLGDGAIAERMTTVVATPDGFLAGGSIGPELFDRRARFWRSSDGATWSPVADDAATFADSEVRAIAPVAGGYVAVGLVGSVQRISGSVAWTSPDGRSWTRIDAADLGRGRAVALSAAPFGGVVAVGSDLEEHEAYAWLSPDGRSWTLAPGEPSRQYPGKVRMTDVTLVGDELIGVGNYVGLQRGTASSWVSSDGVHWQQARSAAVQEQGEFYAVTPGGPGIVTVGSYGAPDDYIPTVWLSPGR